MAKAAPAGAPMWMVTFADLMSLLVCFFVLIISFSVPDTEKVKIVAGSMRNAFGFTREIVVTGMVEIDGNPQYRFARDVVPIPLDNVIGPIDDDGTDITRHQAKTGGWQELDEALLEELEEDLDEAAMNGLSEEERFERIEAELENAIAGDPELEALAENLKIERVPEGLRIQMIDQAGISMFPLGSDRLYPPARELLSQVAKAIENLANPIWIAGHTDSVAFRRNDGYDNWSLSLDRANATRKVLRNLGIDMSRIASVIGKADTEPMIPEAPTDPRNRRISITLVRAEPPPAGPDATAEPQPDARLQ
jgi:chemotaxis protein MotB